MKEIYLDNSATTMVSKEAAEKIMEVLTQKYGNPSSLHSKGMEAEQEVETARKIIADSLGVDKSEIYFTSGGTESNNMAILGAANARKRSGNKIVTTSIEHSSVIESMKYLEDNGYEIVYLKPDNSGKISEKQLSEAIDNKTVLVSIMLANNEIGSLQPVQSAAKIIKLKKLNTVLHSDCVQAYCKIPIKAKNLGTDMITVSSHKIHGSKGVGAIYISKSIRIMPRQFGGEQQKKIRPGTESVPLIAGFGTAAAEALKSIDNNYKKISELNLYTRSKLSELDNIVINSPNDALPHILNFSVLGIRSETMLNYLSSENIFVSSGSACAKGIKSHVLTSMGFDVSRVDSAIRVSFSKYNCLDDIDRLIQVLKTGIKNLAKVR